MASVLFYLAVIVTVVFLVVLVKKTGSRRILAAALAALALWGAYVWYLRPTTPSLPEACVFQVWHGDEELWIKDTDSCSALRALLSQAQIRHEQERRGSYPAESSFIIRIYDAHTYHDGLPVYAGELYIIPLDLELSRYYTNRSGRNGYLFLEPAQLLN